MLCTIVCMFFRIGVRSNIFSWADPFKNMVGVAESNSEYGGRGGANNVNSELRAGGGAEGAKFLPGWSILKSGGGGEAREQFRFSSFFFWGGGGGVGVAS